MKDRVFVIGGNHHNALGVIRSLGVCGIKPYVIIQSPQKKPYISYSKYIQRCWIVESEIEVLDILKQEGANFPDAKAVLIACADNLSSLVDLHRNELSSYYHLPGSEIQGRITHLMDKEVMSNLAREVGFSVPSSMAINTEDDHEIGIPLPWIIKPLVSKDGSKDDIERIFSKGDWIDYCQKHHLQVQVQHLIDKDYEYQLIGLSLNGGEEVIIPGYSYILRPAATTNTGFLHYLPLDDSFQSVMDASKQFIKATGYSGLFSLEFLRDKERKDYFMEMNFRNDGNAICVTTAGVNLPYIWYLYNIGRDFRNEISRSNVKPVYVMPEFADLSLVIHKKLSILLWLKDIRRTDCFMEYDKNDKAPFWHYILKRLKNLLN